jgi:hypothetical protein
MYLKTPAVGDCMILYTPADYPLLLNLECEFNHHSL